MPWYQLSNAHDSRLDELARQYSLHPLHIEDARSDDEGVKVDSGTNYTFAVLKPVYLTPDPDAPGEQMPAFSTIDIFAGKDFLITITEPECPATSEALERARRDGDDEHPSRLLYLILDTIVDLYFPAIDHFDERIDGLEDSVFDHPSPEILSKVFGIKRELIDLRRVLVNTRDACLHLQRDPNTIIDAEHQMYVRDIYDHVARLLDSVETQRDLLNNTLDIYLSSVSNRTNDVMKVLTVLGTIALPALAISGIYGMNLKGLPFEESPHGALYVGMMVIACTALLLFLLRRMRWL
ncbi:MAG: magnesium transporter CorA family protein [Edaphobacter sp.]|uniref:magnesium transporter CorA family protein n=1 Tax=Edaphobacter sp. TaxID=1934404 RepID=UPI0023891E32|nr:magnesium transporter CorA family protein [Edaphobacter sp.]MDE1175992.1 magnesium transporter CorA family protein [Edaphobacter sp.]